MFKYLPLVSGLALLTACSHHQVKKPSEGAKLTGHWFHNHQWSPSKRTPASAKSVPGLKEFIDAVKSSPEVFSVPVGQVVRSVESYVDEQNNKVSENVETVFLAANVNGHFSLTKNGPNSELQLEIHDALTRENLESSLTNVSSVKKVSEQKFVLTFTVDQSDFHVSCDVEVDLKKSIELNESKCVDKEGKLVSETKLIATSSINPKDYKASLKSITAVSYPSALNCGTVTLESEEQTCYDSITDNEARDWSYLIK